MSRESWNVRPNSMGCAKTLGDKQNENLAASVAIVKVHSCPKFIDSLASCPTC